jgi:preprotein translocase subunit SecB
VCIPQLYPYLCKSLADASYQAGFPPITLQPLHAGMMQAKDDTKTASKESTPPSIGKKILEDLLS